MLSNGTESAADTPVVSRRELWIKSARRAFRRRVLRKKLHVIYPDALPVAYVPVPKNGCTTIKSALFALEHGFFADADYFRARGLDSVHAYYEQMVPRFNVHAGDLARMGSRWRFVILRDPVARFLSAYANRVGFHDDMGRDPETVRCLEGQGLPVQPGLDDFVENIDTYRAVDGSIRHHTDLQCDLVGDAIRHCDSVYGMHRFREFIRDFSDRLGREVTFPRMQTDGEKIAPSDVAPATLAKIERYCARDFEYLAAY